MTDRINAPHRTTTDLGYTLQWLNAAGESIPAYGVVQFRTDYSGGFSQASKPNDGSGLFYVNGRVAVASGSYGESRLWNQPREVLITGTPTVGDEVGPVSGSWSMSGDGTGFRVLRQPSAGIGVVVQMGGGGTVNMVHGIVHTVLGCGYYEVEISTWSGTTPSGSQSGSGSDCDICELVSTTASGSASLSDCTADAELPVFEETTASDHIVERQTTGTGVIVLAFHAGSRFVPLARWSDCLMVDLGDENDTISPSDSSVLTEPVYQIVSGHQEHIIMYKERWECCDGVDTLVGRIPVIFAAKQCPEETCNTCG